MAFYGHRCFVKWRGQTDLVPRWPRGGRGMAERVWAACQPAGAQPGAVLFAVFTIFR